MGFFMGFPWDFHGKSPWDFPRKNTGEGCSFLLQRIVPTPGIELESSVLAGGFFTTEPSGKASLYK